MNISPKAKIIGGVTAAGAVVSLVLGIFSLDGRYMKDANADEIHYKQGITREVGDNATKIKLLTLEIQFLASIENRDTTQETQLEIAKVQLEVLLKRQAELATPDKEE